LNTSDKLHHIPILFFSFYVYKFGYFFIDDRTMIFLKNLVQEVRQVAFNLWRIRK